MTERREGKHSLAQVGISRAINGGDHTLAMLESIRHAHNVAIITGGDTEKVALAQLIADAPRLPDTPQDYAEMLEVKRERVLDQEAIELERAAASVTPEEKTLMSCDIQVTLQMPNAVDQQIHV